MDSRAALAIGASVSSIPMRGPTLLAFFALGGAVVGCDDAADTSTSSSSSSSGTGGGGGAPAYVPTPEDIQFEAVNALPSGEFLLINDWNSQPNSVWALSLDGATATEIFRGFRVWSMGVSNDATKIAFASGDPKQKEHYGTSIGDAVQHTFVYDAVTQTASVLAYGNINDECHTYAPSDDALYVCRRTDFSDDAPSTTYRIGKITLADKSFTWITSDEQKLAALHPQPTPDGLAILYTTAPVPTGTRKVVLHPFSGAETELHTMASTPVLDAAGARYLYQDTADMGALHEVGIDGSGDVEVATPRSSHAVRSFDGLDVYYLAYDDAHACSSIDRVKLDGSEAATPTRVYDCATNGRFITQLAFVHRP